MWKRYSTYMRIYAVSHISYCSSGEAVIQLPFNSCIVLYHIRSLYYALYIRICIFSLSLYSFLSLLGRESSASSRP